MMAEDSDFESALKATTDLIFLFVGFILNLGIFIVVLSKQRLRNPIGCYTMSMTIASLLMLPIVIEDILKRWFRIEYDPKFYYSFIILEIILHSASLTVAAFTLDRYIYFCRIDSKWHATVAKTMTAAKTVGSIWCHATILSIVDVKLYEYLSDRTSNDVFFWLTGIYVILPTIVIFFFDFMIGHELFKCRKVITSKWSHQDLESLRLLLVLTVGLYTTIIPFWIVQIIVSMDPRSCCSHLTMGTIYYLLKLSSITVPITCIATCQNLRNSLLEMVLCCRER
ncbi:thyrotropin-releasing hormone receptor-like [Venturia canescens]|uniref:thyrotropin-releasing hormone receptor-like n=1 Tax=Venturia canescens TaxID=32260 RepID=UPI001C9C98BD|nr:thyrotropin-releasing hormone receptor-like [Venturia canescens]XP_043271975.1 thyrotropin-releasing hormone receptor-like [Venturia canescens]